MTAYTARSTEQHAHNVYKGESLDSPFSQVFECRVVGFALIVVGGRLLPFISAGFYQFERPLQVKTDF